MNTFTKLFLYCLFLRTSMVFTLAQTVDNVPYLDANGDQKTTTSAEKLTGSETTLTTGWYLASGIVDFSRNDLIISGDVHLILEDGCSVKVGYGGDDGILITETSSLTIYSQSFETSTMGKMTASADNLTGLAGPGGAGIGNNNWYRVGGSLTINGGDITATGGRRGSGINATDVTVNNGKVNATGNTSTRGAYPGISCIHVTINGGEIEASSQEAGITGTNVTINGGNVKADGNRGAGIGGAVINIHGGLVHASGYEGAGIGGRGAPFSEGGPAGSAGTITITGGYITASSTLGAGIGGGGCVFGGGSGGTIIISGGIIEARGGGAGIGGGAGGSGGNSGDILINGVHTRVSAGGGKAFGFSSENIGAGAGTGEGLIGETGSIFITEHFFSGMPDATGNSNIVVFFASPYSPNAVTVTLPQPFDTLGSISLFSGLGRTGYPLSIRTNLETHSFELSGNYDGPIVKTRAELMKAGASVVFTEVGTNIPYLDANGDQQTVASVKKLAGNEKTLTDGWYMVSGRIGNYAPEFTPFLPSTITIDGDVNIILEDGCSLNLIGGDGGDGIAISAGSSLTIYAQSTDAATIGKLTTFGAIVNFGTMYGAGIGLSPFNNNGGSLTISGGDISAIGSNYGAGISCSNITINSGVVYASGHWDTRGSSSGIYGDNILIYGENTKVTARNGLSYKTEANVFIALPFGNLLKTNDETIGNEVKFTATPASPDIVTITLPAPFEVAGPINLLTGPTQAGITMSVITTMPTQTFGLTGYINSPITKTQAELQATGASVDFSLIYTSTEPFGATANEAIAYPNPVSTGQTLYLYVDVDESQIKNAIVEVYSVNGSLIDQFKITGKITPVEANYATGIYSFVIKGIYGLNKEIKVLVK